MEWMKLSDQLEEWFEQHSEQWTTGTYVQRINGRICYCITGKAASLLGVPTLFDFFSNPYMIPHSVSDTLDKHAQSRGRIRFPSLFYTNDAEGFYSALLQLKKVGL